MNNFIKTAAIVLSAAFMLSSTLASFTVHPAEAGSLKKLYKKTKKKAKSGAKKADTAVKIGSHKADKKLSECYRNGNTAEKFACRVGAKSKRNSEAMVGTTKRAGKRLLK